MATFLNEILGVPREYVVVQLSRQNLAEFLDDNQNWMEQYQAELQRQLTGYGYEADVEIRNVLSDHITGNGDNEDELKEVVQAIQGRMVNDWSWLKQ